MLDRSNLSYRPFPNDERRNCLQTHVEIPILCRSLGLPGADRVLEVGCGRGVAAPVIMRYVRVSSYVGLDTDAHALMAANRRLMAAKLPVLFIHGDVRSMPLADGRFDLVVDFGTLYHISSPQVALTEISRVLRRGGLFVHETRFSQLLAHPLRGGKHALPWSSVPELATWKSNALWAARQKISA